MHKRFDSDGQSASALKLVFVLNLSFTVIEIIGSMLTGSVAILADALHDLGDSLALGIAWGFELAARRKQANDRFTYGYRRLSLLASLFNAVVLTAGATLVLTRAIPALVDPQPTHAVGMIGFAIFGVLVNGWGAWRTSKGATLNESLVSWHLLEDVLGWVAVLIGAAVMQFTDWHWIDPLLAIAIATFILLNISKRLWRITRLFLQVVPDGVDLRAIERSIRLLPGVADLHHLHVWTLDGDEHVASVHIRLSPQAKAAQTKRRIRDLIGEPSVGHLTIEIENGDDDCSIGRFHPDEKSASNCSEAKPGNDAGEAAQ